jgi:hypothetical protein
MNALEYIISKLKRVKMQQTAANALKQLEPELADANTEQLMEGKNVFSEAVGVYRNAAYASFKHQKNPKPGKYIVDLNLTGDFHSSISVTVTNSHVIYTATDSKTDDLLDKYGTEVLGLSPEKWAKLKYDMVLDVLRDEFIKTLQY